MAAEFLQRCARLMDRIETGRARCRVLRLRGASAEVRVCSCGMRSEREVAVTGIWVDRDCRRSVKQRRRQLHMTDNTHASAPHGGAVLSKAAVRGDRHAKPSQNDQRAEQNLDLIYARMAANQDGIGATVRE